VKTDIVTPDAFEREIALADTVPDLKALFDKGEAFLDYLIRSGADVRTLSEISVRVCDVVRKGGRILEGLAPGPGARTDLTSPTGGQGYAEVIAQSGMKRNTAQRWRAAGRLSDDKYTAWCENILAAVERAKLTDLYKLGRTATWAPPENDGHDTCTTKDLMALVDTGAKFSAIYADPPWSFRVYSGKGKQRSAERHYETMTLDEMKDSALLPVERLAADNCALFMWAVMPQIPEALELITAWGFTYKTCAFTWVKRNAGPAGGFATGMGYWTRSNAELCLLATKGSPKRIHRDVQQLIVAPRGEHSVKPQETHDRIERLIPGPYLELFGRRITEGWTVWGNGIERTMFEAAVKELG